MKRVLSLLLIMVLPLAFSACGKNKNTSSGDNSKIEHTVDVKKLAGRGRIPELDFVLGDPVDNVKNIMFEYRADMSYEEFCDNMRSSGHEPDGVKEYVGYVDFRTDGDLTIMSAPLNDITMVHGIYTTENKDAGISAIAVVGDVFGYSSGTTMLDYVKNSIDAKCSESVCEGSLSILPNGGKDLSLLTYEFGAYKLEMYFSNEYNTFIGAVLYDTNIWNL